MAIKKTYMKLKKKAFGSKGVRGRYDPTRAGAKSLLNLYRDIKMIQSRLNVEKKSRTIDVETWRTGQVFASGQGFYSKDVTPNITQGTDSTQRIGNSLKLTGMNFPIQFNSMEQCRSARKLKVMLFRTTNDAYTPATLIDDYYDPNPINGIRDMNSPRKYATTKQNGIKLIRSQIYHLKSPSVSVAGDTDESCLSVNFAVKLQDVLRYDNSTAIQPDGLRYFIYVFCDAGNADGAVASSLDVPIKTPASGVDVRVAQKYWYVDN